ncbi:hypothetical protein CYMTET_21043 [Cymbomonas tetramitiformis]|uniref:CUE domain-containing protein n=1 Tax=Cymbomonas tetramitiformis TaxID=36881 RepID=A0AAE0G2V7_9CHLO|nr:hypothetical protein CYMTET_21043 [Cymbomonas tetramitiformis]
MGKGAAAEPDARALPAIPALPPLFEWAPAGAAATAQPAPGTESPRRQSMDWGAWDAFSEGEDGGTPRAADGAGSQVRSEGLAGGVTRGLAATEGRMPNGMPASSADGSGSQHAGQGGPPAAPPPPPQGLFARLLPARGLMGLLGVDLEEMAISVGEVLPHAPREAILRDLHRTWSVERTVNNLLESSTIGLGELG